MYFNTGVSCTKVLHLFNEAQIFGNLFVTHTIIIIEPLYDKRHHQHIYTSPYMSITTHFQATCFPAHVPYRHGTST